MFRTTAVLLASILAVAAIARAADSPAAASRPNIILILADDVGSGRRPLQRRAVPYAAYRQTGNRRPEV